MSMFKIRGIIGHSLRMVRFSSEILYFRIIRRINYSVYKNSCPLISVVIPTMPSRLDLLCSRALPSIEEQTYKNIEVILIFDEKNDQILELTDNYKSINLIIFFI